MKFIITFSIIASFIIEGVQNAPAIHPIHIRTIPLHPVTVKPTSDRASTGSTLTPSADSSWYSSSSIRPTDLTSSSVRPSTTTYYHPSWWNNRNSVGQIFLRIFFYAFLMFLLSKFIGQVCKSRKQKRLPKSDDPVGAKNKMCVSTIGGQREESPPAYVEIHKV